MTDELPAPKKSYSMKAESGSFKVTGNPVTLRHVERLPDDHDIQAKLGSITTNLSQIDLTLRRIVETADVAPGKPMGVKLQKLKVLEQIQSLAEAAIAPPFPPQLHSRLVAFGQNLKTLTEERNRLMLDAWGRDKATGELIQHRTTGPKKTTVVDTAKVDQIVSSMRQLVIEVDAINAEVWRTINP